MTQVDRSPSALRSLYQEVILDHHRRPRNRGAPEGDYLRVHKNNPTCGDEITLYLQLSDGRLSDLRFTGQGCSISQASASMTTMLLQGKTAAEVHELGRLFREMLRGGEGAATNGQLGDLRALAGVARFPARVRCAILVWVAVEEALERADEEVVAGAE